MLAIGGCATKPCIASKAWMLATAVSLLCKGAGTTSTPAGSPNVLQEQQNALLPEKGAVFCKWQGHAH